MKGNKIKLKYVILLFIVFLVASQMININVSDNSKQLKNQEQVYTSAQESYKKEWIENPDFSSLDNWTSKKGSLGDPNDVDADISGGQANFIVIGNKEKKEVLLDGTSYTKWQAFNKTDNPLVPNNGYQVSSDGVSCSHLWDDNDADQTPIIYWRTNVSMGVDMSDYKITHASLEAVMNASVHNDIDVETDTYSIPDDYSPLNQRASYDFAQFFVEVADMEVKELNTYELAFNETETLGQEGPPTKYDIEGPIETKNEQAIIDSLTNVLAVDPGHDNFTLILGIYIYCADNYQNRDEDSWLSLQIKYVNLSFIYEKKINQLTSISWNQEGDKPEDISNDTVVVDKALLNFKYMINNTWPTSSPNSEIRMLINDVIHTETIKLSSANETFKEATQGGFDITYLIEENKAINLSIQVYLADNFELNQTIRISIDNVSLEVSYTLLFQDYQTNLQLFLNGANKTSTPSIILPVKQNLTITVKYTNQTGGHIEGANLRFTSGLIDNLTEYANNYSITFNVTQKLSMYDNFLKIKAEKRNHDSQEISFTVTVREINVEIETVSGQSTINIASGGDASLGIILNDTDNNKIITDAIVTYSINPAWDGGQGFLTENLGVYEGLIENPPDGLYTITISAIGSADYNFNPYEITLNVGAYVPEPPFDWSWLVYLLVGAIMGLVIIFSLYIKYWRFPPLVRKIRRVRKKIRKGRKIKPLSFQNRDKLTEKIFHETIEGLEIRVYPPKQISKFEKTPVKKEGEA